MRRATFSISLVLAAACSRSEPPKPVPAEASAPVAATSTTVARGLDAPGNAPRIVAAVKRILAECTPSEWGPHFKPCDAVRAYKAMRVERADAPTLVAIIEDARPAISKLGAETASRHRDFFRDDAALAERLVAVGESLGPGPGRVPLDKPLPKGTRVIATELAGIVCRFDLAKTGLFDRIQALVRGAAHDGSLRAGIVSCWLRENPNDARIEALTKELEPGDEPVNRAAQYARKPPPTPADCAEHVKALGSKDPIDASVAASLVLDGHAQFSNPWIAGWPDGSERNWCPPASIEAALAEAQRRAKSSTLTDDWLLSLGALGKAENVSAEIRTRATALAKATWSNPRAPLELRHAALLALASLDPPWARTTAMEYGDAGADFRAKREAESVIDVLDEAATLR